MTSKPLHLKQQESSMWKICCYDLALLLVWGTQARLTLAW